MTTADTSTTKPRRTLSEEQKAKMRAGRLRKAEERRRAAAAAAKKEAEPAAAAPAPAPLVKTNSAAIREAQEDRSNGQQPLDGPAAQGERLTASFEDVVQRHVARDAGLSSTDAAPPDVDDAADELPASSFHSPDDAVPAPAVRPELRDRPTVHVRDDGDDAVQNIPDIMREWGGGLDAGTCYIRVERKKPPSSDGLMIKGTQRPITQSISEEEFIDIYGGGTYDLVVYGPSQRGHRLGSDGRTQHRRLSSVINITIPLSYPPNINAAVLEGEEEDMQQITNAYRGVRRTNADAKVHETDLEYREREVLRNRHDHDQRIKDERERADQIQRESSAAMRELRQSNDSAMQMLRETHQVQMDMMKQQMEAMEKRFQDNQSAIAKKPTEGELAIDFAKAQLNANATNPEHAARVEQAASAQREQLVNQHREELRHMRDEHRQEVERLQRQMEEDRRRGEERVETARKSVDERLNEIQRQANERVADAEKRAEREVKSAKEEAERRIRDTESSYKARMEDLDRSHQRDLSAKDDSFTTRRESLENTHSTQLAAKDAELVRLREENEKLREENKKPLGQRMREFKDDAEEMGFSKGDGEDKDWKSTLVETGMGVLGQLPQIVQSVSSTLQSRQRPAALPPGVPAPQQLPPPVQGRGGGIAAARDFGGWATEDGTALGDDLPPADYTPEVPGEVPTGPTMRPHFAADSSDIAAPSNQPMPQYPTTPPPQHQEPPPQATQPPPQQQIVHQQAQPNPTAGGAPVEITDEQILAYSRALTEAVDQGASPEEYFDATMKQWGPEMVHAVTHEITPDRITQVLQEQDPTNSLLRRDGQQFMKQIWAMAQSQS